MAVLKYDAGLLAGKPIKKEITYTNEETGEEVKADIYVKQGSLAQVHSLTKAQVDGSLAPEDYAKYLATSIVNENGEPIFKPEEFDTLKNDLIIAMIIAVGEVRNEKKQTKSAKKKN